MGYVSAVLVMSLFGTLAPAILPSGSVMKKYFGLALSLTFLLALIHPMSGLSSFLSALDDCFTFDTADEGIYELSTKEWLMAETDEELRRRVSLYAEHKYGLPLSKEDLYIRYRTDSSDLCPIELTVFIKGKKITKNLEEFRRDMENQLFCDCRIDETTSVIGVE